MIDNPDQRIADDLRFITDPELGSMPVFLEIIHSTVSIWVIVHILLETAPPLVLAAFGHSVSIPGSTIWYALAYVLLSSVVNPAARQALCPRDDVVAASRSRFPLEPGACPAQRGTDRAGRCGADRTRIAAHPYSRHPAELAIGHPGAGSAQRCNGLYERLASIIPLFILVPRYFAGAITFAR